MASYYLFGVFSTIYESIYRTHSNIEHSSSPRLRVTAYARSTCLDFGRIFGLRDFFRCSEERPDHLKYRVKRLFGSVPPVSSGFCRVFIGLAAVARGQGGDDTCVRRLCSAEETHTHRRSTTCPFLSSSDNTTLSPASRTTFLLSPPLYYYYHNYYYYYYVRQRGSRCVRKKPIV